MTGFCSYLTHDIPQINQAKYIEKQKKFLKSLFNIKEDDLAFPLPIGSLGINWDQIFEEFSSSSITKSKLNAEKIVKFIFSCSEDLISYNDIQIFSHSSILNYIEYIIKNYHSSNPGLSLDMLRNVYPLFLRCPFTQLNSQFFIEINNKIKSKIGPNPFLTAISTRCLIFQMSQQNDSFSVSNLIMQINTHLKRIYGSCYSTIIIPFLANDYITSLYSATELYISKSNERIVETLACYTYIAQGFVLLSSIYPICLEKVNWRKIVSFFARMKEESMNVLPSHPFFIQFPELNLHSTASENIIALYLSHLYLSNLSQDSTDNHIYIHLLHTVIIKSTIGKMALAQALVNTYKLIEFEDAFLYIISELKLTNCLIINILCEIFYDNYSELTYEISKFFDFTNMINVEAIPPQMKTAINDILLISNPSCIVDGSLSKIIRSLDGFLLLPSVDFYEKTKREKYFENLSHYLLKFLKNSPPVIEIRSSYEFSHLSSSFIELVTKYRTFSTTYRSNDTILSILPSLVLMLYDSILVSCHPILNRQDVIFSPQAEIFMERMRFARHISKISPRFFQISFLYVEQEAPSLAFSNLMLLADVIRIVGVDQSYFQSINSHIIKWIRVFILSESLIIHHLIMYFIEEYSVYAPKSSLQVLVDDIIHELDLLRKSYQSIGQFVRAMGIFMRLSSIPKAKCCILDHQSIIIPILLLCIDKDESLSKPVLACIACDTLLSLCSHSITQDYHIEENVRYSTESIDHKYMKEIIKHLSELLHCFSLIHMDVANKAIRLMRFLSENPFFIFEMKKANFNLPLISVFHTPVWQDDDFPATLLEMACSVSKFDSKYAAFMIGWENIDEVIKDKRFSTMQEISIISTNIGENIQIDLPPIYEKPLNNFRAKNKNLENFYSLFPSCVGYKHLYEIPIDFFNQSVVLSGTP